MDLTFVLSAAIFTLLAIVVATSLFNGSSSSANFVNARSYFGHTGDGADGRLDQQGPRLNGHVPDKKKKAVDDWCEVSGSSHDHWDVVKSVLSEEAHPNPLTEELATPVEHSSSASSLSVPRPGSRHMSLEVDSSSEASSGRGRRSFIGLSDKELLKCAFSYPQTEGATESPGINDQAESNADNSLRYVPGKSRSHHLQMMMSKDELEEEQRVQREQLAAIFQLLKDNKETFGEVSEGDIEEQLKLYSI
ncbi:matrix-remodeling-associated protein 7 isoform X1 [Mastacembelus armatus]|uniref:matrix-remodeling-associated protein 7 isoform X1 n=1 Tax=Mastacembelus armatus TaxID=205130 RepID=UPI000E4542C7|nr:matrix-remodeling-associated protein 7-like isoform X1 [Mastacembelus armatus]